MRGGELGIGVGPVQVQLGAIARGDDHRLGDTRMTEKAAFEALRSWRVEVDALEHADRSTHVRDRNERKRIRAD